jgi:transcriptional regulator with XRE-family HTH domain
MSSRAILARHLRNLRAAQEMSQEELAHRAGIDRTYVSALERQLYSASVDVIDALAKVFGIRAADLIDDGFDSGQ